MTRKTLFLASCAMALSLPFASYAADPELTVFDWAGFEDPNLQAGYIAKHGQMPTYVFFGDDDEAFAKVANGFAADLIHPCSQMVSKYRDAGLIEPWDVSRIPEWENIAARYKDSEIFVDAEGVWFIPSYHGYTAIAWAKDTVPEEDVSTLQVFLDPKYAGRVSLPDNTDDIWSLAFLATGVSDWTNFTEEQFQAAAQWLRDAHPNVVSYWSDPTDLANLMASGQVQIAWSWNDGIAAMRDSNFNVGFQRNAKEGAASFFCGYINGKGSAGSEDKAYDFINAWLDPASAQGLLDGFSYGHNNEKAFASIPMEEKVTANIDPIEGTVLAQVPIDNRVRDRLREEFENIKAGF